jgi:hypothetical protein
MSTPSTSEPKGFEPARHVALCDEAWRPETARQAIRAIVADAETSFDAETYWPSHPQEDGFPGGTTGFYLGACGVLWAMDFLKREGVADHRLDAAFLLPDFLDRNRKAFAEWHGRFGVEPERCSYLFGDAPILLMMIASPGAADDLFGRIESNLELPLMELMWGVAGLAITCVFAHAATGEDRWRALFLVLAGRLLGDLTETEHGPLWTQDLYGRRVRILGPVHGYADNMLALLQGWAWLSEEERTLIRRAVPATLAPNAQRSQAGVNWPPGLDGGQSLTIVQYCHGAPGIVTACADRRIAQPELTSLLAEGAELVWKAGPLAKGSNLCHGTGGNGFAFLKMAELAGEPLWLDRARAFAMTAIDQWRVARRDYGQGRYSLWTGDVGLALYLNECLKGSARFPTIDIF